MTSPQRLIGGCENAKISTRSFVRARSFFNDLLLAASAREIGAILVTENGEDFGIIADVIDIHYAEPWP